MLADLTIAIAGVWIGRDGHRVERSDSGPDRRCAVAVPVLVMPPASTSAWVVV